MQDYFYNENKNKHEIHVNHKLIKVNKSLEFFTNCILHLDIFLSVHPTQDRSRIKQLDIPFILVPFHPF